MFSYNNRYLFFHPWTFLWLCWRELQYAWQRIFRGWDDRVIWSIDWYLAEVMPVWIRRLKETKIGYPMGMEEDEWDKILDGIIEGFEAAYRIMDLTDEKGKDLDKFHSGMDLFKEYFFNLWD